MQKVHLKRWSLLWLVLLWSGLALSPITQAEAALSQATGDSQPYFVPNLPTGANHHRVGIATHPWWLDMHLDTFVANFKQLGVGVVRLPLEWKTLEPAPGQYSWSLNDRLLSRLNDEGFEIVVEFVTIPVWASNNPTECAKADLNCAFSPVASGQFEAVVEAAARRYPFVRYWEFWNEPEQWPNAGRDVSIYGAWLKLFYRAVKKADPTMQVAATTLAGPDYVRILYNYIEATTGGRIYPWDAISYHPYNLDGEKDEGGVAFIAKQRIEQLRQIMIEHNDSNKPLWISEIGFSGSPTDQSKQFQASLDWLLSKEYITMVALHMLHDWAEESYGLMSTQPETYPYKSNITTATKFSPKQPYYDTYKNYPKRRLLPQPSPNGDTLVFPETGHTVRGIFKRTWQTKGGLELFGFPKTGQFYERNAADKRYYLVQYFERVRMEYHPDLQGTPFEVQYGLLGNETMTQQGLLDREGLPKAGPTLSEKPFPNGPDNLFFPETGHNLSGPFLAAWKKQGGLSIIGFPRSAVYDDRGPDGKPLKVQYFERARMELHTASDGRQFILFGLLSNQRLVEQGRLLQSYQPILDSYYNPANVEFAAAN